MTDRPAPSGITPSSTTPSSTTPSPAGPPAIRLGYHGSVEVAHRILRLAGHDPAGVLLSQYDVADPFRGVRDGGLDLMIVKFRLDEPDLAVSRVLAYDARAAVVGAGHPLAGRESVSIEELADYDAFERPGTMPDYVWDEVVPPRTPAGRTIHRRHRVTDVPRMMALVAKEGAVHISLVSLADVAPPGIRVVPIHDLPPAPVALAWSRDAALAPHIAGFLARAEAAAPADGAPCAAAPADGTATAAGPAVRAARAGAGGTGR
ncbi:LysR substrate-binding domain-containing protein [Streptomyces sp. NPDC013953]|uniref:LysR substrate-binding domain-containing protein n=1 Tax=Streptomyces sp. NPDC013953 TaxID=3364868 RepID=UPI0036F7A4C9